MASGAVQLSNLEARNAAPVVGSYICDDVRCEHSGYHPASPRHGHCWHDSAHRRLTWHHGEARANRITLGIDPATQRDIGAWNRLGATR